jgi:tetratricopeptide (TPR) repeat protein
MFMRPDIEKVPIDRLITNLEQLAAKDSKDAKTRFNLARVHSMAFAFKTPTADIIKGREAEGVFFGFTPEHVPFKVVASSDPAALQVAREHLSKAINLYREVAELDPANLTAKLGYAWCLDQAGNRAQAITAYRHVVAAGWKIESAYIAMTQAAMSERNFNFQSVDREPFLDPRWHSITVEATRYLIPLLDRAKDQDEIVTLQDRVAQFNMLPRSMTPIVIPLRDGLTVSQLVDPAASVRFDADGSGLDRPWSWITPNAAWLVHAPKESRRVSSALQLFGSVTFWVFWENGYHALRALDDDGDGELRDKELDDLGLWHDANSNGVSDAGEVKPLADWEITALSWAHETRDSRDYVAFSRAGVTFRDGRTRPTYDVLLHARPEKAKTAPTE